MHPKHRRAVALLPLALLALVSCRSVPLIDPAPISSTAGVANNRAAILLGMGVHGWTLEEEGEGFVKARMNKKGKHQAVVRIAYSDTSIAIAYADSVNLSCQPPGDRCETIHRAYNRWAVQLAKDIEQSLNSIALVEALEPPAP